MTRHIWTQHGSAAFAQIGAVFDPFEKVHQMVDSARFAETIQEARDAGDYAAADAIREKALRFGMVVRNMEAGTFVFDGKIDEKETPTPPDYSGGAEWVGEESVNGRNVIDRCYTPGGGLHSLLVMKWRDHPNIDIARSMGFPLALWKSSGQVNLNTSKSADWAYQQIASLEMAAKRIFIDGLIDRIGPKQAEA